MSDTVKITGKATHSAARGDTVEVEIDLGIASGDFITALPDEPAHVALIRLERENDLRAKLTTASLTLQHQTKRAEMLAQEFRKATHDYDDFIDRLAETITGKLMYRIGTLLQQGED